MEAGFLKEWERKKLEQIKGSRFYQHLLFKFYYWGFRKNVWLSFHLIAASLGAFLLQKFFSYSPSTNLLIVLGLAVFWEIVELALEARFDPKKVYGSVERWVHDSLGDILGALLIAYTVLF